MSNISFKASVNSFIKIDDEFLTLVVKVIIMEIHLQLANPTRQE